MQADPAQGGTDAVLAGLDPEQRAVVLATRGPVCVLAGAGTGKTRAITHRIAYAVQAGLVNPAHVLALTFTARAAGELRARLRRLAGAGHGTETVAVTTFHAAALGQLTDWWPRMVGGRPPRLLESKVPLVMEAAQACGFRLSQGVLTDTVTEIEWAKVTQVPPEEYPRAATAAARTPLIGIADMASLYEAYEQLRRGRRLLDFESVLELTAGMLADNPLLAERVRDRHRYFIVDEYQDVNPLQKLLLDMWLGDRDDLCVVGDPNQTIYSFAGATNSYLTRFTAEFPDATVVRLVRTYRSTPQVVALANRLVRAGMSGALIAARPPGPDPTVVCYDDEHEEAAGVTALVRSLLDSGVPARRIAVLVRVNAHMARFERAFGEAGVPYQVRGVDRFYDRPEVRQAIMLLRGALRGAPDDRADAATGPTRDGTSGRLVGEVRHILSGLGLVDGGIGAVGRPPAGGPARARWESLAAIVQLAEDLCAVHPDLALREFVADLQQRAALGEAPMLDGVTLASMHAAKGLEWDVVILPGLVEGVVPIVHARTPAAVAEERRLLYVAVTRARERLVLSWAAARGPEEAPSRRPSRFLAEVGFDTVAVGGGSVARWGRGTGCGDVGS